MNHICVNAHAKINLALDVLSKRPDGYHDLKMIMQTLHLHDALFIKKTGAPGFRMSCDCRWLPVDGRNLIHKAVARLSPFFPENAGVYVDLTKAIPVSAGLAGGSADCAAALLGLRKLFSLPFSDAELASIGKELGADVPFCLLGGTALAAGVGDVLTTLRNHPVTIVLLAKPLNARVSTGGVFGRFSQENVSARPDVDKMAKDIENRQVDRIAQGFCNVLESVTIPQYPVVAGIKALMRQAGALNALMSGSGPCVFGYFKRKSHAMKAIGLIKNEIESPCEIILTSTYCPKKQSTSVGGIL